MDKITIFYDEETLTPEELKNLQEEEDVRRENQ